MAMGNFWGRVSRERKKERGMEGEERCFEDIHRIDDDSTDGNGIILVKRGDGEFCFVRNVREKYFGNAYRIIKIINV